MNIFKALFGNNNQTPEEKKKEDAARQFDVLKYDGVRALKSHQAAYAVKCLTHALEINDDLECRDYLAQALMQTGELAAAYEQLSIIAEKQPDNQQLFLQMANLSYMLENYVAMSNDCEKAMLIDDSDPQVYLLYAKACRGQGDETNAEAMLTKAISLKNDFFEAYLLRGELLLKNGRIDEASQDAAVLLDHINDNEDVLLFAARIELAKNNTEAAIDVYNKVMDVNPFCITALRERAAAEFSLDRKEEAEADLKAAAELDEKNSVAGSQQPQDIEEQVKQIYKNIDPYGIFSH